MHDGTDEYDTRLDAPLPAITGQNYLHFLKRLHRKMRPEWYLEIGTHKGRSLVQATCRSIAVDPMFRIDDPGVFKDKPELHLFKSTSDDFFLKGIPEGLTDRIDLAFLDGMHRFEFLLRDFMNTERLCGAGSVVTMHDMVPMSYAAAERETRSDVTKSWTGDVWKIVPVLREYRPDLEVRVVDAKPSGLGFVTGLDPENTALHDAYHEIVARYVPIRLRDFGEARAREALATTPQDDPFLLRYAETPVAQQSVQAS